jgi:hypothetical protein
MGIILNKTIYLIVLIASTNTVGDLYDENEKPKPFIFWKDKGLRNTEFMKWRGLVSSVIAARQKDTRVFSAKTDCNIFSPEALTYFNVPIKNIEANI